MHITSGHQMVISPARARRLGSCRQCPWHGEIGEWSHPCHQSPGGIIPFVSSVDEYSTLGLPRVSPCGKLNLGLMAMAVRRSGLSWQRGHQAIAQSDEN